MSSEVLSASPTLNVPARAGTTEDVAACAASIHQHSKSFSLASRFLPHDIRNATVILYAWCRRADDLVDEVDGSSERAELSLCQLRAELDAIEAGHTPDASVARAFATVIRNYGIPLGYARELLAGMQTDVAHTPFRNWTDTLHYSYRVASTVGLMLCHVFGVRQRVALQHAAHLGIAMQLSNICRDVAEDDARGRSYLPTVALERNGERRTVLDALDLADGYYASADAGLRYLPWRVSLAVRAARLIYADIGRTLRQRKGDPRVGRAVVSAPRKVWLLLVATTAWLGELATRVFGEPRSRREPLALVPFESLAPPHGSGASS